MWGRADRRPDATFHREPAAQLAELAEALQQDPADERLWAAVTAVAARRAREAPDDVIAEADRLREERDFGGAATAYGRALDAAPQRTDLRVQLGNMLKDSGQLAAAEAAYRHALEERPDDADIHLQLGHTLKLRGKRAAALTSYRRAAVLDPSAPHARHELALAGSAPEQAAVFDAHWQGGGTQAALSIGAELLELRAQLDRMMQRLPEAAAASAFPVAQWDRFRRLYPVPPAPPCDAGPLTFVLQADDVPIGIMQRQLAAMRTQDDPEWRLLVITRDADCIAAAQLAASGDARVHIASDDLAAGDDWCVLLAKGALPDPAACGWFKAAAAANPAATGFVCDEDVREDTAWGPRFSNPQLRQVVDYDTLLEANVWGETVAVSPALACGQLAGPEHRAALLLRLAEKGPVGHIPLPLVSIPSELRAQMAAPRSTPRVTGGDAPEPIGVVIPTRNNAQDLLPFVASLQQLSDQPDALHVVVLDNGAETAAAKAALAKLASRPGVAVRRSEGPFNWSALNNQAARDIETPILLFANDDMLMLSQGWDSVLRDCLARPGVGAAGARLVYEDGTLQHAGVLFGWGGAPTHHDGLHEPGDAPGPARRWQLTRSTGAVTGAFLATRREQFLAAGGFDAAALPVAYSDIDYALKLRSKGLRILWTPHISLAHKEGASRGLDHLDPARAARNAMELDTMQRRWGPALRVDPGVNPHYYPATLPFHLIAAPTRTCILDHIARSASQHPWLCSATTGLP